MVVMSGLLFVLYVIGLCIKYIFPIVLIAVSIKMVIKLSKLLWWLMLFVGCLWLLAAILLTIF